MCITSRFTTIGIAATMHLAVLAQGGSITTFMLDTAFHGFAESVVNTTDGGFAIASSLRDAGPTGRVLVTKTDAAGVQHWSRAFGPVYKLDLPEVVAMSDGGVLAMSMKSAARDLLLIRLNDMGDTLWATQLDSPIPCMAKSAVELAAGDLLVASHTHQAFYLTRISAQGTVLWSHGYQGGPVTIASLSEPRLAMVLNVDSTVVIAGALAYTNATESENFILKADLNGNVIWGTFLGGDNEDAVRSAVRMDDGGYLLAGYHWLNYRDPFLLRLDSAGNVIWSRIYPSLYTPVLRFILRDEDGGHVIGGRYQDGVSTHGLLFKVDDQGDVMWSYEHGAQHGFADGVRAGNGAAMVGPREVGVHTEVALILQDTLGAGSCTLTPYPLTPVDVVLNDVHVVNVIAGMVAMAHAVTLTTPLLNELHECQSTGFAARTQASMFTITPNPASGMCALQVEGNATLQRLEIIDAQGRTMMVQERPSRTLDLHAFAAGPYLIRVFVDGVPRVQRLMVQ